MLSAAFLDLSDEGKIDCFPTERVDAFSHCSGLRTCVCSCFIWWENNGYCVLVLVIEAFVDAGEGSMLIVVICCVVSSHLVIAFALFIGSLWIPINNAGGSGGTLKRNLFVNMQSKWDVYFEE